MRNRNKLVDKVFSFTHGHGNRLAIISGVSASGKSWVLEQLGQRLGDQPHRLIRTSASDSTWPLSGLLSFLSSIPVNISPEISALLPRRVDEPVDCFQVAMALHCSLTGSIEPGTVFLIDDLDFMDADSQQVLGFLATRLQGNRISFIATAAPGSVPAPFGAFVEFRLELLDRETLREIANANSVYPLDGAVGSILASVSQGNPGNLMQLFAGLTRAQQKGYEPLPFPLKPRPDSPAGKARGQAMYSEEQLRLLRSISMAPVIELEALLRMYAASRTVIDALIASHAVELNADLLRLTDNYLRSALYWSMADHERLELHRQLAKHTSIEDLRIYHEAQCADDPHNATRVIEAATSLLRAGQVSMASGMAEWAFSQHHSQIPTRAVLDFAQQLAHGVYLLMAQRYVRFALAKNPQTEDMLRLTMTDLELQVLMGEVISPAPVYALVQEHAADHPYLCGTLMSMVAVNRCLSSDMENFDEDLAVAAKLLEKSPDMLTNLRYNQALLMYNAAEQNHKHVLAEYQRWINTKVPRTEGSEAIILGKVLGDLGHHEEAGRVVAKQLTHESRQYLAGRMALLQNIQTAIQADDVPRGLKAVEAWNAVHTSDLLKPLPRIVNAWYWIMRDRPDKARPLLDSLRPFVLGDIPSGYAVQVSHLEGEFALMQGAVDEAITHFQRARHSHTGRPNLRSVKIFTSYIEALITANRLEKAANEFRTYQSILATVQGRQAKLLLRRAQAMALPGEAAVSRFQSLLEMWQPGDSMLELARIRHCCGIRLLAMNRNSAAVEQLVAAKTLYRNIGAQSWARRLENQLAQLVSVQNPVVEDVASNLLSPQESQLVAMVHRGLTNKDIADELYISVSAVEARLTRLFRKSGTKNRQQLSAHFSAAGASA